jgi:hypothetical protein
MKSSREPEALPVITEQAKRGARARAQDEQGAREGILVKLISTHGDERIDAFTPVDGLDDEQDAKLGDDLDHGV